MRCCCSPPAMRRRRPRAGCKASIRSSPPRPPTAAFHAACTKKAPSCSSCKKLSAPKRTICFHCCAAQKRKPRRSVSSAPRAIFPTRRARSRKRPIRALSSSIAVSPPRWLSARFPNLRQHRPAAARAFVPRSSPPCFAVPPARAMFSFFF